MDSICRFIPAKSGGDLKTVHFVYETEFRKMKQPFLYPIYYMHLVTRGKAVMKLLSKSFPLEVGTIYFAFPGIPYEIEGSEDFTYMYISFMGLRAGELMTELRIPILEKCDSADSSAKRQYSRRKCAALYPILCGQRQ